MKLWWHKISAWFRKLARRGNLESELNDELLFHQEMLESSYRDQGLNPREAHRRARRELGHIDRIKEASRDQRRFGFFEDTWRDIKQAVRSLLKTGGITGVAILILALSIATTALTHMYYEGILKSDPPWIEQGSNVVMLKIHRENHPSEFAQLDADNTAQLVDSLTSFEAITTYANAGGPSTVDGTSRWSVGKFVSANFFEVMEVQPAIGRTYSSEEQAAKTTPSLVISHKMWQNRFGGREDILGQQVLFYRTPRTVIGVMPQEFTFPHIPDYWAPIAPRLRGERSRAWTKMWLIGSLKPGVSTEAASAELANRVSQLSIAGDNESLEYTGRAVPLREFFNQPFQKPVPRIMAAATMLQLIALLNVIALVVARGVTKRPERALRAALGATRFRLWRETMAEIGCIVGLGWLIGVVLAWASSKLVIAFLAPGISFPNWWEIRMDWSEAVFTLLLSGGIVAVFATFPLWKSTAIGLEERIRGLSPGRGVSVSGQRFRDGVVITQFAVAVPLLLGATFSILDVRALSQTSVGIDPTNIGQIRVTSVNRTPEQHLEDMRTLQRELEANPEVIAAAFGDSMPGTQTWGGRYPIEYQLPDGTSATLANVRNHVVSSDLPALFGMALQTGRWLEPVDASLDSLGVLVDTEFARRAFGDDSPLGKRVARPSRPGRTETVWGTVVGVVSPTRANVFTDYAPTIYLPESQLHTSNNIYFKSRGAPSLLMPAMIEMVDNLGSHVFTTPSFDAYEDSMDQFIWQSRFESRLLTVFGLIALMIIVLGLIASVAFVVAQKRHEIGVRMALGARPPQVLAHVIRGGLTNAILGTLIGLGIGWGAAGWAATFFDKVSPHDASIHTLVVIAMLCLSLAASLWPAKRATQIDPIECLRAE